MAWVKLDDNYLHHPKFTALSSGAFRLWHEGMCYCRKLMNDGLIPRADLKTFRYASRHFVQELTTARSSGSAALWLDTPEGYRVHDYRDWNPDRAEAQQEREATKLRMRAYRGRRGHVVTPPVTPTVTAVVTPPVTEHVTPHVPGQGQGPSLERESERKPLPGEVVVTARSKRPIFRGERFAVFEWMLDDLRQILGPYYEEFDLHAWFYALDAQAIRANLVMPKRDNGAWLQAQLLEEAKRRGLAIAGKNGQAADDPYAHFPHAWQCAKCGEIHEGTAIQAAVFACLKAVRSVTQ